MTARYRSRLVPEDISSTAVYTWPDGSPYFTQGSATTVNRLETMTDYVSPGYFAKRRKGEFLPVNDMEQHKSGVSLAQVGTAKVEHWNSGVHYVDGVYTAPFGMWGHVHAFGATWSPAFLGSAPSLPGVSPVLTEALANARSKGFDVLTFLVELKKTLRLVAQFRDRTLKRAEKIADTISSNAVDPLAEFSATWLEGRYGWRILAYDLEGITEAFYKLNSTAPEFIRGYATETNTATHTISSYVSPFMIGRQTPSYGNLSFRPYGSFVIEQTMEKETRAGVVLEALLDDLVEIDPLVTAWEVIPFSFIVDWFINVNEVLLAYSPFASENLLGAWTKTSERTTTSTSFQLLTGGNAGSWERKVTSGGGTYLFETISYDADRLSASPSANLSWKVNLDGFKITDLASIFLSRWGGILGKILKSNRV